MVRWQALAFNDPGVSRSMLTLDHLAIAAETLEEGVARVEESLGVSLEAGGRHAAMGTHNRLLGLGPGFYLEVIAIDPAAPPPGRARWFDLDRFTGPPRLTNWAARCSDLPRALEQSPEGAGDPLSLTRGELRWQMAVPASGQLPFSGLFPALLAWKGDAHPSKMLSESQCRLQRLELIHPAADELGNSLTALISDARLVILRGPRPRLRAMLSTPAGERTVESFPAG